MQKHLHYRRYRGIALHLGGVITSLWLGIPLGPLLAQHEGHGAVGAPSEGGPEGQAAMPGHAAPSALVAWLPTLFWIAIAALAVWVVVQTLRGRRPKWLRFQVALGLAAMIGTYAATAYIVKTHKRPGQMTVIEAQAMDMSVMKAPVGTAPVVTDKAGRGDFDARVTYTGTVVAFNDEDVYPRVTGWIRQMPVYPGDRVQSGQMVARLDATELGSKENEVAFARLSAEQMRAQTVAEEVQARAMRAQAAAEQTYARGGVEEAANDLASSRGMITEAQRNLAAARAMARQTEREQAGARSALRASRSEVTAAQEAKAQAEASVSDAQAELSSMEADLAAAQANAASWRPRLKRSEALEQKGAISLEELQRDQADAQAAESMVSAAAAKVRRAKAGVSSAEAAVRQAAAMVGAAEAKQEQMQAEVDAAQAKLEQAHANAEAMDAKITQARASAGAAQARVTQMQAMLGKSDASVRGAVAGIDAAARKRMGAGAAAEQMRAALTTASVIKGYTEIRASGPGVVTQRLVSPGVLVNPGTPILRIAQIDRVRLQANVAEKDVAGIRVGSPVRVPNMKDPGSSSPWRSPPSIWRMW